MRKSPSSQLTRPRCLPRVFGMTALGLLIQVAFCGNVFSAAGNLVSRDEALRWNARTLARLRAVATSGDAKAQNELGIYYYKKKSYLMAYKWYRISASHGYASAEHNLAYLFLRGKGVKRDYAKALALFTKLAVQGDANAQRNLGFLYMQLE